MEKKFLIRTQCKGVGRGNGLGKFEITLRYEEKECRNWETLEKGIYPTIGISGHIKGSWGQCLDEMWENRKYIVPKDAEVFRDLYEIWRRYHLNDMQAGTKAQTEILYKCPYVDYTARKTYLAECNMLTDNGYIYGHGWLCKPIPTNDLKLIKELLA